MGPERHCACLAVVQTLLLVTLNVNGLLWARHIIHDPGGMVVKNFAFLVLVWVSAGFPEARGRRARDCLERAASTRGAAGKVLFGRMYEDAAIEPAAFRPGVASSASRRQGARR